MQRYELLGAYNPALVANGAWVRFTDHEAALAAARDEGYHDGYTVGWEAAHEDRSQVWNAALDAVLADLDELLPFAEREWTRLTARDGVQEARNAVAALRKTPPQPEPLIWVPCEYCGGGGMADDGACLNCHGRGDVQIERVAAAQPEGGESWPAVLDRIESDEDRRDD